MEENDVDLGGRISLKQSVNALSSSRIEDQQVEEVLAFVHGSLPCSDPSSVRVLLSHKEQPQVVVKLTRGWPAIVESTTLADQGRRELESFFNRIGSDVTLLETVFQGLFMCERLILFFSQFSHFFKQPPIGWMSI